MLDRFIIPGVMPNDVSAAEALEEMFIHYADSYSGQEENIRLQSQIKKFTEKLQGTLPLIKDMWNADEAKTQSVHALADYLLTIERKIEADTAKKSQLEESIDDLKARLHRIQAEKASKAFYRAKEVFDSAEKQLKESTQRKENAEMRLDSAARMVNVLNAAKEYAEIIEKQNEEKALIEQITALDNGTQDTRIISLKYSLLLKAANEKKQTEQEISYQRKSCKCLSDELSKKQSDISRLRQQLSNEKDVLNQSKGKNSYICGQIEKVLKSLGLHITVMLDGRYSAYDIESICSRYERIIGDARKSIENFENEEKKLKQELDGQYVKRDKLTRSLADNMVSLKQQKAGSDKYKKDYQTAITVLKHLSVPENRLFSDEPVYNMLIEKGYPKDKLVFDKYESGRHEPMYWRNIYPEFLQAMFEHKVEALECGVPIKYEDRTGFSSIPSVISIAPDDPGLSVKENFIYFDNSRTKWDKVFAYWWDAIPTNKISGGLYGDEWPGIEMERIEGTDIYRLVMPMGPSKIVFSSGVKDEDVQKGTIAYQTENMDYDDQENAGQIFRIDTSIEPRAREAYEKTKFKYSSGSWEDFEL